MYKEIHYEMMFYLRWDGVHAEKSGTREKKIFTAHVFTKGMFSFRW